MQIINNICEWIISILTLLFALIVVVFIFCGIKISHMTEEEIQRLLDEEEKKKNKKK
jgi:uncharacterized membrane protein